MFLVGIIGVNTLACRDTLAKSSISIGQLIPAQSLTCFSVSSASTEYMQEYSSLVRIFMSLVIVGSNDSIYGEFMIGMFGQL